MKAFLVTLLVSFSVSASAAPLETDLCIYGGTSAGVIAAVQASTMGKKVILVEAGQHLGGMSVEGSRRHGHRQLAVSEQPGGGWAGAGVLSTHQRALRSHGEA